MIIAIIDDDDEDIDFMKVAVDSIYPLAQCLTFRDCESALSSINALDLAPDYVFLDVVMNKVDGEECLRLLRQCDKFREAKIVMMSSSINSMKSSKRDLWKMACLQLLKKRSRRRGM